MKKRFLFLLSLATVVMTGCKDDDVDANGEKDTTPSATSSYSIKTFASEPFLGEMTIEDYDFDAGNEFMNDFIGTRFACTSFRNGDFHARNLDLYVRDYGTIVLHIKANKEKGRYASVSVVNGCPYISTKTIKSGVMPDTVTGDEGMITNWRNIFPIYVIDGINEKGLCVNLNVVVKEFDREGYVANTGANPGKKDVGFMSVPRYILDNCSSCQDAIDKLSTEVNVVEGTESMMAEEDCHYMLSDEKETVVLEWYNNALRATRYPKSNGFKSSNGMPAIMTNFYNCVMDEVTTNGTFDWDTFYQKNPLAMGTERWQIVADKWASVATYNDAKNLIDDVKYTKFYDQENYKWYSENAGYYYLEEGKWAYVTNPEFTESVEAKATTAQGAMKEYYESDMNQTELKNFVSLQTQINNALAGEETDYWASIHTIIYDIANKKLDIRSMEGHYNDKYYSFGVE